jgi:L-alanine-DL-glutamate epimerase-like enolase superfamily enzyme
MICIGQNATMIGPSCWKAVGLKWLEEPLWPPENFDGLAQLRTTSGPIAAGETQ